MRRIAVAVVLIVAGATTASLTAERIAQGPDHVDRYGRVLVGGIVAVERTGVVVSYSLLQKGQLGVARPQDPLSYAAGDLVTVTVLDDAKDRVVIRGGGEVAPMGVMIWLVVASLIVLFGIGLILMQFLSTPVAGHYSLPNWRNDRHGGA